MSPAEAGAITDEPDWVEMFDDRFRSEFAFEEVMLAWRRWHWTPVLVPVGRTKHGEVITEQEKQPASATEAIIALAGLGIMPPRTLEGDGYQHDDHCFLMSEGRQWRIVGVEDKTMILTSDGAQWQIDLSRATWGKYIEAAAAALKARMD